jgi:hypothetical protein
MAAAETLSKKTGILPACKGLGIPRSTFYDRKKRKEKKRGKAQQDPNRPGPSANKKGNSY